MPLTHDELVARAERWLYGSRRCKVVLAEPYVGDGEQPDAIGWHYYGSIVVECKTSRNDFYADKKKPWRRHYMGMGNERFFLTDRDLLNPDSIPPGWGLLEARGRIIRKIRFVSSVTKGQP